jgi:hypothetical protein
MIMQKFGSELTAPRVAWDAWLATHSGAAAVATRQAANVERDGADKPDLRQAAASEDHHSHSRLECHEQSDKQNVMARHDGSPSIGHPAELGIVGEISVINPHRERDGVDGRSAKEHQQSGADASDLPGSIADPRQTSPMKAGIANAKKTISNISSSGSTTPLLLEMAASYSDASTGFGSSTEAPGPMHGGSFVTALGLPPVSPAAVVGPASARPGFGRPSGTVRRAASCGVLPPRLSRLG